MRLSTRHHLGLKLSRAVVFAVTLCAYIGAAQGTQTQASTQTTATSSRKHAASGKSSAPQPGGPIDLNSASEKDLDSLPGVGPATAKKIIAGRPYTSVSDLSKAGLKPATIQKLQPMVMVGPASRPAAAPMAQAAAPQSPSQTSTQPAAAPRSSKNNSAANLNNVAMAPGGGPGLVWVNKETKVYHVQGDRWYGKTKSGQYMTIADAQKAGFRPSKQDAK